MRIFLLTLLFLAGAAVVAQEPETLPDRGFHENPACTPRGSKTSVRCGCLKMVDQVHTAIVEKCWGEVGVEKPTAEMLLFPPKVVMDCFEKEDQSHCQIIARYASTNEEKYNIKIEEKARCKTSCLPQRCQCADEGCKSHEEAREY